MVQMLRNPNELIPSEEPGVSESGSGEEVPMAAHQIRPLSLVDKLKQRTIQDFIRTHLWSKTNLSPIVVELDPTTACNLACHDCISANLLNQGGIEDERLMKLAEEFATHGVKAVVLIGGGEPMAHRKFGALVDALKNSKIQVGVTTNGTMINRYMDQCARTDWLRVSVDAGSTEVYADFRPHASGKSQFDLCINNMRELAKRKTGLLGYSFLLLSKYDDEGNFLRTNAVDIERAGHLAKEIGCDYFEVKPAFDMMHFLQHPDIAVVETVNKQFAAIRELADEKFKVIAPATLDEALGGASTQVKSYTRCLTAELRTVITPSGTYVCPYHRGNMNMRIGDVKNSSLEDLWKSPKRAKIMERVNPSVHCSFHCIRHETNLLLERMAAGETVEAVDDYDLFI